MLKRLKTGVILFVLFSCPLIAQADSAVETLSPELRQLLVSEMLALEKGMQEIIPALVSGDMDRVIKVSRNIKNSYIMKQSITRLQKKELMDKLPDSFLKLDKKFHEYGSLLGHFAEQRHYELVAFYFSRLTETCVECHSQFATHKYPAFLKKGGIYSHTH